MRRAAGKERSFSHVSNRPDQTPDTQFIPSEWPRSRSILRDRFRGRLRRGDGPPRGGLRDRRQIHRRRLSDTVSNFIAEWYGVRLYPSAAGASGAIDLLRNKQCPCQGRTRRFVERVDGVSRVVSVSAPCRDSVPSHWNFSRFVRRLVELEERAGVFEAMMRRMGEQLREALPDFGEQPRFRGAGSGVRREGGAQSLDRSGVGSHGGRVGPRCGLGPSRDPGGGWSHRSGVGEGQVVVRASDGRHALRGPGVVPGDEGVARGGRRACPRESGGAR